MRSHSLWRRQMDIQMISISTQHGLWEDEHISLVGESKILCEGGDIWAGVWRMSREKMDKLRKWVLRCTSGTRSWLHWKLRVQCGLCRKYKLGSGGKSGWRNRWEADCGGLGVATKQYQTLIHTEQHDQLWFSGTWLGHQPAMCTGGKRRAAWRNLEGSTKGDTKRWEPQIRSN